MKIMKRMKAERDSQGESGTLNILCLTASMESIILSTLETAIKEGSWVIIQNCHLAGDCSGLLERLTLRLATVADIHPGFRLWLTARPHDMTPTVLGDRSEPQLKE